MTLLSPFFLSYGPLAKDYPGPYFATVCHRFTPYPVHLDVEEWQGWLKIPSLLEASHGNSTHFGPAGVAVSVLLGSGVNLRRNRLDGGRMKRRMHSLVIVVGLTLAAVSDAHHSAVMFDTTQEIVVEGVVTRYEWRNPHVYMAVETIAENGDTFEQQIEAGAPSILNPLGLTPDSLMSGERVTVFGNPNKGGVERIMLGKYLTIEDGS